MTVQSSDKAEGRAAVCNPVCWTPATCGTCRRRKAPRGRSLPLATAGGYCDDDCPGYRDAPLAPHLWDEHDDARHYSDPDGWAAHVAACARCSGDDDA